VHSHWHYCSETHWQWQGCLNEGCCLKENEIQSCLIKKPESDRTITMTEDFYPILFKATTVTCLHTHLLSIACSGGLDLWQIWNTISNCWANWVRTRKKDCMFPQSNKWNFQWSMSCWSIQSTPFRYYTWKEFNHYYLLTTTTYLTTWNWIITAGKSHIDCCKMFPCSLAWPDPIPHRGKGSGIWP